MTALTHVARRSAFSVLTLLSLLLVLGTSAAAELTHAERLAAREAARVAAARSGDRLDAVVVDGTPRPAEAPRPAAKNIFTPGTGGLPRASGDTDSGPMRSLTTALGEAGMEVPLGGDDVIIGTSAVYGGAGQLVIASDGTYFVAIAAGSQIDVFKSVDGGETWSLWSSLVDPLTGFLGSLSDMDLAEGTLNRILLAWRSSGPDTKVRVAYADPAAGIPTWTIVTALGGVGIDHGANGRIDIDTDAFLYPDYYVYVVAMGNDGAGTDIWFTRSVDMGSSYTAGYRIADNATGTYERYGEPVLSAGHADWIHTAFVAIDSTGSVTSDLAYRRVPMWGDGGLVAWEAQQIVEPEDVDGYSVPLAMSASTVDGNVIISTLMIGLGSGNRVQYSTNYGATWPDANEVPTGLVTGGVEPLILPSGDVILGELNILVAGPQYTVVSIVRSSLADLTSWTAPQATSKTLFDGIADRFEALAADPTRGQQLAFVFNSFVTPNGSVRFDAEWRRDPGFGNTEVGFPVAIAGGGQTPPAIAEVDGDPFGEIVFGTLNGDIHVLNHDGTPVPGWPVNIGPMPIDAPVAVGHLGGGGFAHVVAGNNMGEVYAFDGSGTLITGWPAIMDDVAPVYVSIGAFGPPYPNYVIAACNFELRAINVKGQMANDPAWATFTRPLTRPAAIGDVNNDGVNEIVTLKNEYLHVNVFGQQTPIVFRYFPGEIFTDAPTLADIDLDGDLEIAAPTSTGKMYLMHHTGADVTSWPITVPSGQPLTAASFANVLGGSEPELAFAEQGGSGLLHLFTASGGEQPSYPLSVGGSLLYMPPIVALASAAPGNLVMGMPFGTGYSYANIGGAAPGWPRNLPVFVEETPAAGDIDNDGRTEIVFLGVDNVTVLDMGVPGVYFTTTYWPMYGFDPERTGCHECFTGPPVAIDDDVPSPGRGSLTLEVYPNPFNPSTTVAYEVTAAGPVTLTLYDVRGQVVDVLMASEHRIAGRYAFTYAPRLATGVYFLKMESADGVITQKLGLLK